MRHTAFSKLGHFVLATVVLSAPLASAAPVLRHQSDLRGDVTVIGSTLAYDCGSGIAAQATATTSCSGLTNTDDTAPDLYWRDGVADLTVEPNKARTSATLAMPAGSVITYARLYWAALRVGADPDLSVVLDRLYGPQVSVTADDSRVIPYGMPAHPDWSYYQATADVTAYVAGQGPGDFRITDVEAVPLNVAYDIDRAFSAWTLVVFYQHAGDELHNLALFDAFDWVDPGLGQPSVSVNLAGFLIPSGFSARMTAFAYEGDVVYTGDRFLVNGTAVSNGLNPVDNFFNGSRTYLGQAVSGAADVPKLSGKPGSMAGYDLDTMDVSSMVHVGDTTATVAAESSTDIFMLGGFVTSVTSLCPNFNESMKTVVDLNGGAVLPGEVVEYTVTVENTGNDAAKDVVLSDTFDGKLNFVPGSINVVLNGALVNRSDAAGDDQAEYNPATRTLTVRLGTNATAAKGGTLAVGATAEVRFRAAIVAQSGAVLNQGTIKAAGQAGCQEKSWLTDGDADAVGSQPTIIYVDQCTSDSQCSGTKPHCDPTTHSCQGCRSDADCPLPGRPACQPDGSCGQCSAGNQRLCVEPAPVCNVSSGTCVPCTSGPQGNAGTCADDPNGAACVPNGTGAECGCYTDADCGGANSGRVCDTSTQTCVDGCRGSGNGCPAGSECTSADTTLGTCQPVEAPLGAVGDGGGCGGCRIPTGSSGGLGLALVALLALAIRRRAR